MPKALLALWGMQVKLTFGQSGLWGSCSCGNATGNDLFAFGDVIVDRAEVAFHRRIGARRRACCLSTAGTLRRCFNFQADRFSAGPFALVNLLGEVVVNGLGFGLLVIASPTVKTDQFIHDANSGTTESGVAILDVMQLSQVDKLIEPVISLSSASKLPSTATLGDK